MIRSDLEKDIKLQSDEHDEDTLTRELRLYYLSISIQRDVNERGEGICWRVLYKDKTSFLYPIHMPLDQVVRGAEERLALHSLRTLSVQLSYLKSRVDNTRP